VAKNRTRRGDLQGEFNRGSLGRRQGRRYAIERRITCKICDRRKEHRKVMSFLDLLGLGGGWPAGCVIANWRDCAIGEPAGQPKT
jgi:hypothetical protein